jgi:hypothetical protein
MKKIIAIALFLPLAAYSRSGSPPRSPDAKAQVSMAANAWRFRYSPGMPPQPAPIAGGWYFVFPSVDGVHYLTTAVSGRVSDGSIALNYEIIATGSPVFDFHTNPNNRCASPPSAVSLYFQRRGDDMSGNGAFGSYRFFSKPLISILSTGAHTLTVPLTADQWVNVWGQNDAAGFAAALADVQNIGMTFGGGCFSGHGVFVTGGSAQFIAKGYMIQ